MRIAISGPGRSGTSLLVRLLGAWGFRVPDGPWYDDAAAGLEARLGSRPDLEVEKDPWAFEYIRHDDGGLLASYDAVIIPVRKRDEASISRSMRDRLQRALHLDGDEWRWDSWGIHAGGVVADTTAEAVSSTLGRGLWDLLEAVSAAGIDPIIINFPRFATDFDYLWRVLSPVVAERVDRASAERAWAEIVDPSKIRIATHPGDDPRIIELEALVAELRGVARREAEARAQAEASSALGPGAVAVSAEEREREQAEAQRAHQVAADLHHEVNRLHEEIRVRDAQISALAAEIAGRRPPGT